MKRRGIIYALCAMLGSFRLAAQRVSKDFKETIPSDGKGSLATFSPGPLRFVLSFGSGSGEVSEISITYKGEEIVLTAEEIMAELKRDHLPFKLNKREKL